MIDRIFKTLKRNEPNEKREQQWDWCYSYSTQVEINENSLENMANSYLVHGFFGGTDAVYTSGIINKFAAALGIYGLENPEGGANPLPRANNIIYSDLELLTKIQAILDFDITFPPFIGGRIIIKTPYGIVTERHLHYLWVVKRILELCPDRNTKIVEIGGGIGLLGWYLDRLGYKDFTIIDLSRINACQTYFLYKNLPHRNFILSGEAENPYENTDDIKILHSTDFVNVPKNRWDIMINIDGLTEMGKDVAFNYVDSDCSPMLLSINHEVNNYRMCELNTSKKLIYRYPFWLREGYVEELYKI